MKCRSQNKPLKTRLLKSKRANLTSKIKRHFDLVDLVSTEDRVSKPVDSQKTISAINSHSLPSLRQGPWFLIIEFTTRLAGL